MPPSGPGVEKRNAVLCRVHVLLFGVAESQLSTVINPPPPLPGPTRAGGVLCVSHRRGVRRSCDWSMAGMNNETEPTRRTGNTDQPLRWYRRENCDGRHRRDAETPPPPVARCDHFHAIYSRELMEWHMFKQMRLRKALPDVWLFSFSDISGDFFVLFFLFFD